MSADPAPLKCRIDGRYLLAITERDSFRIQRDALRDAILRTAELYAEPVRYTDSRGRLKPNLSVGFETRFQAMYDLARRLCDGAPPPDGGTS